MNSERVSVRRRSWCRGTTQNGTEVDHRLLQSRGRIRRGRLVFSANHDVSVLYNEHEFEHAESLEGQAQLSAGVASFELSDPVTAGSDLCSQLGLCQRSADPRLSSKGANILRSERAHPDGVWDFVHLCLCGL